MVILIKFVLDKKVITDIPTDTVYKQEQVSNSKPL